MGVCVFHIMNNQMQERLEVTMFHVSVVYTSSEVSWDFQGNETLLVTHSPCWEHHSDTLGVFALQKAWGIMCFFPKTPSGLVSSPEKPRPLQEKRASWSCFETDSSHLESNGGIRHPKRHLKSNPGPKAIYQRKQPHLCNDSQVIQIMTYIPSYPHEKGHQLMGASSPMKRYQAPTLDREWHILATVPPHPQPLRWCIHRSWG